MQTLHYFSFKDFLPFSQEILCLLYVQCHSLIAAFGTLYFCDKYMYIVHMINLTIASQGSRFRKISVHSMNSKIHTLLH
jgi:hypothetical protein